MRIIGIAGAAALACSAGAAAAQPYAPWAGQPAAAPAATPQHASEPAPSKEAMELLPRKLSKEPEALPPGGAMQTMRPFGAVTLGCNVLAGEATCNVTGLGYAQGGDPAARRAHAWTYALNREGDPILLVTVASVVDAGPGLRIVYGADALGAGDLVRAFEAGARVSKATLLGCQPSGCVFGFSLRRERALLAWMLEGKALVVDYAESGKVMVAVDDLSGFAAAYGAFPASLSQRIPAVEPPGASAGRCVASLGSPPSGRDQRALEPKGLVPVRGAGPLEHVEARPE